MKKRKFILKIVVIVAMALGMSGVVHAIPCTVGFVNGGGSDYICEDGLGNDWNTDLNAGAGFFGFTDWDKLEKNDGGVDIEDFNVGLGITGLGTTSGTWSFSNDPWGAYSEIMLVLKGGNGFSAYKVAFEDLGGDWDSGGSIGRPDLSHMSVYGVVPEPATILFLGSGLFGFGVFRKKFMG